MSRRNNHLKTSFFLVIMFLSLIVSVAASAETFINKNNENEFIELKEGNQFILRERGVTAQGEYQIEGNELLLHFTFGNKSYSASAAYDGSTIKDNEGKVWVKKSVLPPILIAILASVITIVLFVLSKKVSNRFLLSLAQLISVAAGILMIGLLSEDPGQARITGTYYFYILLAVALISKIFFKSKKASESS